ncbi:MAG: class I SAM-dependent methyltransferase [Streptomycetales bacterium]
MDLRLGDAQSLDFPDDSFDTVVCTFSLCAIPDEQRAIEQMHRVLRPGGMLVLADHVAAAPRPVRWRRVGLPGAWAVADRGARVRWPRTRPR